MDIFGRKEVSDTLFENGVFCQQLSQQSYFDI